MTVLGAFMAASAMLLIAHKGIAAIGPKLQWHLGPGFLWRVDEKNINLDHVKRLVVPEFIPLKNIRPSEPVMPSMDERTTGHVKG